MVKRILALDANWAVLEIDTKWVRIARLGGAKFEKYVSFPGDKFLAWALDRYQAHRAGGPRLAPADFEFWEQFGFDIRAFQKKYTVDLLRDALALHYIACASSSAIVRCDEAAKLVLFFMSRGLKIMKRRFVPAKFPDPRGDIEWGVSQAATCTESILVLLGGKTRLPVVLLRLLKEYLMDWGVFYM